MNPWFVVLLVILVGGWLLHVLVEWLNLHHVQEELPEAFAEVYPADQYRRSQQYLREVTRFGLVVSTVERAVLIAVLVSGAFGWLHRLVEPVSDSVVLQGLVYCALAGGGSFLLDLPFSAYSTFVLEERYGFNKTTWKTFVLDRLKGIFLAAFLGGTLLAALIWFFDSFAAAWVYAWGMMTTFQLVLTVLAPALILPLFFKCEPLADGALKGAVTDYAEKEHFQLAGIFKADGSRRSSKANAFFTGLGRARRIVLFDTLIEKHSTGQLLAVLAHEMGHYKKKHISKQMLLSTLTTGLMLCLIGYILKEPQIYAAFGVAGTPVYAGLVFAGILFAPLNAVLSVAGNGLSRRYEFQADRYAAETVEDGAEHLGEALKALTVSNLGNLTPHPLKVFLAYSHPPVLQRLKALADYSKE